MTMERRSERLAVLQKLKPISYRETGVKRVFKKIRRKRQCVHTETKESHKTWKENKSEKDGSMKHSGSDDSEVPCCSKYLVDQRHLLIQHSLENPPSTEPIMDITTYQEPPSLLVEGRPRPFKINLAFLTLLFILSIFFRAHSSQIFMICIASPVLSLPSGFRCGFSSLPDTLKEVVKIQLRAFSYAIPHLLIPEGILPPDELSRSLLHSHQSEFLQQNLQKHIGAFRQKVYGLQNFADALRGVHAHWELQKNLYMQAEDSKPASKNAPRKDFALKSAGASVVKSSKSFKTGAKVCMLGFCWDYSQPPHVILERDNSPGNCWAMDGSQGYVIIKLSKPICPMTVALDHISKTISHTEEISSAPQNFSVFGFKNDFEKEEGNFLGSFVYRIDAYPTQMFKLEGAYLDTFKYLLLKISSNWNHPNYTCIYGFRVYD